jgi:hypothetical protein
MQLGRPVDVTYIDFEVVDASPGPAREPGVLWLAHNSAVESRIVKTFAKELDQRMQSTCPATAIILLVLDVLLSDKIVPPALNQSRKDG